MNKRSAMMVAAGLVLAMLVAGMAVAAGLTGPEASAGGSRANGIQDREPKVRTITETVTIHRTANSDDDAPEPVIVTQSPATPSDAATGVDDDGYEHGDEDGDDEYEDEHEDGEDHGWDDEGGEDHEDEDD